MIGDVSKVGVSVYIITVVVSDSIYDWIGDGISRRRCLQGGWRRAIIWDVEAAVISPTIIV
jgi:hypothetical protein